MRRWVIATWSRRECAGGVRRECEAEEIGLKIPVGGRRKCGQGRRSRTDKFPKAPQRHKTEGQMTDNSGSPLRWQTPQSGAWGDADQQRPGGTWKSIEVRHSNSDCGDRGEITAAASGGEGGAGVKGRYTADDGSRRECAAARRDRGSIIGRSDAGGRERERRCRIRAREGGERGEWSRGSPRGEARDWREAGHRCSIADHRFRSVSRWGMGRERRGRG